MVNYANGKIYRIVCNTTGKQYIGSTTRPLSERLSEHKSDYKRFLNKRHNYVTSFEILKNDNCEIVLIENLVCDNKEELYRRERFYIETMNCINKIIPSRTKQEYTIANHDKFKQYYHEYYKNNIEKKNIYHSEYREKNKNLIIEKRKEYYKNNSEKFKERRQNNIFQCICGLIIQKASKSRHLKTLRHIAYLESLNNTN